VVLLGRLGIFASGASISKGSGCLVCLSRLLSETSGAQICTGSVWLVGLGRVGLALVARRKVSGRVGWSVLVEWVLPLVAHRLVRVGLVGLLSSGECSL
jgi:hypothetical protein